MTLHEKCHFTLTPTAGTNTVGETGKKNKVILLCFFQFYQPQCLLFESGVCPHTATYIGEEKKKKQQPNTFIQE